jgi:hypothetical protein
MRRFFKKNSSGYALVETIFYIALLVIISIAVVNGIITMAKSFKETAILAELSQGGVILERISREVRDADSILSISSSSLRLQGKDSQGASRTSEFVLSGGNIQFFENGALVGNLNPVGILVGSLSFSQINTNAGRAVATILGISSARDSLARTYNFFSTASLRDFYVQ